MIELIALLTMFIDHAGLLFFPEQEWMRVIGRIALPIYAFGIAKGYTHTKNKKKYGMRLLLLALVSQYPYMELISQDHFNIIFTLLVSYLALASFEYLKKQFTLFAGILSTSLFAGLLEVGSFEYGMYALILVFLFHYVRHWSVVVIHLVINLLFYANGAFSVVQLYSVLGSLVVISYSALPSVRLNRFVYQYAYPLHLYAILFYPVFYNALS